MDAMRQWRQGYEKTFRKKADALAQELLRERENPLGQKKKKKKKKKTTRMKVRAQKSRRPETEKELIMLTRARNKHKLWELQSTVATHGIMGNELQNTTHSETDSPFLSFLSSRKSPRLTNRKNLRASSNSFGPPVKAPASFHSAMRLESNNLTKVIVSPSTKISSVTSQSSSKSQDAVTSKSTKINGALAYFLSGGIHIMQEAEIMRETHISKVRSPLKPLLHRRQIVERELVAGIVERMLRIAKVYTDKFDSNPFVDTKEINQVEWTSGKEIKMVTESHNATNVSEKQFKIPPPSVITRLEGQPLVLARPMDVLPGRQPFMLWMPRILAFLPLADMKRCTMLNTYTQEATRSFFPLILSKRRLDVLDWPLLVHNDAQKNSGTSEEVAPPLFNLFPPNFMSRSASLVEARSKLINQINLSKIGRTSSTPDQMLKDNKSSATPASISPVRLQRKSPCSPKHHLSPLDHQTDFAGGNFSGHHSSHIDILNNPWLFMASPKQYSRHMSDKDKRFYKNLRKHIKEQHMAASVITGRVAVQRQQRQLIVAEQISHEEEEQQAKYTSRATTPASLHNLSNDGWLAQQKWQEKHRTHHLAQKKRQLTHAQQMLMEALEKRRAATELRSQLELARQNYVNSLYIESAARMTLDFQHLYEQLQDIFLQQEKLFSAWHTEAEADWRWKHASDEERAHMMTERNSAKRALAACKISALVQGVLGRKKANRRAHAVTILQRFCKRTVRMRQEYNAAVQIQAMTRRRLANRIAMRIKAAACKLTHKFKERFVARAAFIVVKVHRYLKRSHAALHIQTAFRVFMSQQVAIQRYCAMVTLQRFARQRKLISTSK